MLLIELFESRGADLYHGTNLSKLNRIIQDNVMTGQSWIHSDVLPTKFRGHHKTVSFSRDSNMATNFARSKAGGETGLDGIPVMVVIDQEKLYRLVGRRLQPYNDLSLTATGTERSKAGSESEEVVYGNISNINSVIKKIVVHMPKNSSKNMLEVLAKCKVVFNDPRTVVVDFLNKNLTGRQFSNLVQDATDNKKLKGL